MSEHQEFLPPRPAEEEQQEFLPPTPPPEKEEQEEQQEIKEIEMEQLEQDVKTLGSIIQLVIATNSSLEKYKMSVSPKAKLILEKLLGEHKYFDNVQEYISAILLCVNELLKYLNCVINPE